MPGDQSRRTVISFGPFEADLHTQELRKLGVRLRLPRQSFQILKMLLERAGGLVTREELQQALWPSDTFVDFEGGVNAAVNRLREALGDSADSPHFVETLPRRGYRFIGAIGPALVQADAVPLPPSAEARNASASGLTWLKIGTWILAGMACGIAGGFAYLRSRPHPESVALTPVPFTAYPGYEVCPDFSPDGSQVAFAWNGDPPLGSKGFDLYVKVIGSENLLRLTRHPAEFICPAWSPDGTQIAFHRISGVDTGVYVLPALGGSERRLRATHLKSPWPWGAPISWSPDGKWIAFAESLSPESEPTLRLLAVETLESREIPHGAGCVDEGLPAFSHTGKQLAYMCLHNLQNFATDVYSVETLGGALRLITTLSNGMNNWGPPGGIAWTGDDKRLIVSRPRDHIEQQLEEINVADGSLRKLSLGENVANPAISAKGDKLAYTSSTSHISIWRKDALHPDAPPVNLIFSTRHQADAQYSPHGRYIVFSSTRGGAREIWMSDADGTHLVQLSNFKNALTGTPRWSPDSKKIAFDSRESGHPEVYVVDISERVPRMLVTKISEAMMPSWSHDGEWIYFVSGGTAGQKLYRCPISGGDAVLLSEAGGWYPLESLDGETVYFPSSADRNVLNALSLKHPSAESPLEGMPRVATYNMWTVGPGGIYFARAEAPQSVCYFDFATKKSHLLFEAAKPFWPSLSVSSDGRWILYSQWDEDNADIMLVDHFR